MILLGLKDLDLKVSYESGTDDLLNDFYIKTLEQAVEYNRISGFFSSTSLAVSARGVKGLVCNGGKMHLIMSPRLSEEDITCITNATMSPEKILESSLLKEIDSIEDLIINDHVAALGWLIAHEILEIKIAVVYDDVGNILDYEDVEQKGIFHIKVGVIKDKKGDTISFSGSINETASGWMNNVEEFKVFKMWQGEQKDYCKSDIEKFNSYWNTSGKGNVKIYDIPDAVKKSLLMRAPRDIGDINCWKKAKKKSDNEKNSNLIEGLSLFDYQLKAIQMWWENGKRLICEMATGTGKTRVAIGCITKLLNTKQAIVIFVVCPQGTLALQWKADIDTLKIRHDDFLVADGTVPKWRIKLEDKLLDIALKNSKSCIVYTTFDTFSKLDFMKIVTENKGKIKYMLIGDEVHGMGATVVSRGLLEIYEYRLGLSATPKRWFDDLGTAKIINYFGNKTFEFTIKDALITINPLTNNTYLTKYIYKPFFTVLSDDEIDRYNNLTKQIIRQFNKAKNDTEALSKLENMMFIRAAIHKSAFNKYEIFEQILEMENDDIRDMIVFVSDKQMQEVINIMSRRRIRVHKITQEEGTKEMSIYSGRSERQYIIDKFKEGDFQALLAIKCLDEGIDIPSAEKAVLLASSSNPREYIQRIGRVIRRFSGKEQATIYDIIIKPEYSRMSPELIKIEKRIFDKELIRVFKIANNAENNADIAKLIFDVKREGIRWE